VDTTKRKYIAERVRIWDADADNDQNLVTPAQKLQRRNILQKYQKEIDAAFASS
jgi:long-chain acyl-CoA synthetase